MGMVQLFYSKAKNRIANPFRSRLARQIAAWVFLGIVAIEGVVFVPSYVRRRAEELQKLEAVSQEVLSTLQLDGLSDRPERFMLENIQLRENSVIQGLALYNAEGQLITSLGDAPDFSPLALTQPMDGFFLISRLFSRPSSVEKITLRKLSAQGSRYDVAWITPQMPNYILAIRHDATAVQQQMRRYVLGVAVLVVIVSAFVTLVTLAVLQQIVIQPLLLLRDDLSAVGEAIAQGKTPVFVSLQRIRHNEMGEVSTAFKVMFERIQKEIFDRQEAEADLRREQTKAERLLLNILPAEIAAQLKENEHHNGAIASRFDSATVLFADIVNFTNIAAHTSPTALVRQLNDIFSAFDAIAQRHHLEKIKTIGDAYMVVGGLPSPSSDHAQAIIAMAIEMMEFAQGYTIHSEGCAIPLEGCAIASPAETHHLCLRIGINTGPVVAGVIGTQKFSYDLWGDTVNIASRMESHGVINRIQVSENTYHLIKDTHRFEDRGYLLIKGRGEMKAFLLEL
jgi:adenylate cyclase